MSVGFTIGASTTKLVGRALNLWAASIEGSYSAVGAGGAVAAGAGGLKLGSFRYFDRHAPHPCCAARH
jgi:hypothetical protein